jgi:hypothetical protein
MHTMLVGKPLKKRILERLKRGWEDNVKVNLWGGGIWL